MYLLNGTRVEALIRGSLPRIIGEGQIIRRFLMEKKEDINFGRPRIREELFHPIPPLN